MSETCPDCGGGEECENGSINVQGCRACCRDCGFPCDQDKDAEGFHEGEVTE